MKSILSIVILTGGMAAWTLAQMPVPALPSAQVEDGDRLMRQATEHLAAATSIEAKLRQRVRLLGQELVGSGNYWQLRAGEGGRFRLEMKLTVGDEVSTLVQVCDGQHVWIRKDLPSERSLSVISLSRVSQALQQAAQSGRTPSADTWLMLGGLPKLMEALCQDFSFGDAVPTHIGQTPVWQIPGTWKPERLIARFPELEAEIRAGTPPGQILPDRLPHYVVLMLAREPRHELFPYRVDFLQDVVSDQQTTRRSVACLEMFEVRRRELDRRMFRYNAQNQTIADRTGHFLESIGLENTH